MSDLISRQDAIDSFGDEPEVWNDTEEEWAYRNAWVEHISAIKSLPSADAVSRDDLIKAYEKGLQAQVVDLTERRPTGEWIDADGNKVRLDADGHPLDSCWCSNCGEWLVASDEYKVLGKFCPNCGARMGGDSDG